MAGHCCLFMTKFLPLQYMYMLCTGLKIEKNMTCQTKSFSQFKYHLACHSIFLPVKNGEVSYVVEMNIGFK